MLRVRAGMIARNVCDLAPARTYRTKLNITGYIGTSTSPDGGLGISLDLKWVQAVGPKCEIENA